MLRIRLRQMLRAALRRCAPVRNNLCAKSKNNAERRQLFTDTLAAGTSRNYSRLSLLFEQVAQAAQRNDRGVTAFNLFA